MITIFQRNSMDINSTKEFSNRKCGIRQMDTLLFGISGLPIWSGIKKLNYASSIDYIKSIGLDAMELLFVRNVNVTENNRDTILNTKIDNDFYLSAHGSHYINLNANELEKQEQSIERIKNAMEGLAKVKGRSLIFHPGFLFAGYKGRNVSDN